MRLRLFVAVTAIAIAAATIVSVLAVGGREGAAKNTSSSASEHSLAIPTAARTVTVSRAMPMPSADQRRLSAMLEEGTMPAGPIMAEVLTDSECTPDARMISRCRNVMRLANGQEIVLRHPHEMATIPCLAPGERVRLIPAGV